MKELHKLKTDIFMGMVESGAMPLRPGVKRLVGENTMHLDNVELDHLAYLQSQDGVATTACCSQDWNSCQVH